MTYLPGLMDPSERMLCCTCIEPLVVWHSSQESRVKESNAGRMKSGGEKIYNTKHFYHMSLRVMSEGRDKEKLSNSYHVTSLRRWLSSGLPVPISQSHKYIQKTLEYFSFSSRGSSFSNNHWKFGWIPFFKSTAGVTDCQIFSVNQLSSYVT